MSIEAIKQMVKALESATVDCSNFHHAKKDQNHHLGECPLVIRWHHAIEAGKQAIAELESQEPVAWMREDGTLRFADGKMFAVGQQFYTHPPQRKPLTDEQIEKFMDNYDVASLDYARAIEAAHGIKE